MKILTAEEMGAADRRSAELGVPVRRLMQQAGAAVARFVLRRYPGEGLVVVLCGKGNNGGDGLVAAHALVEAGRGVRVVLLGAASEVKGEAAHALATVRKRPSGVEWREVTEAEALGGALEGAELVVDAVVGTGFRPPLRGLAAAAQELLATMSCPVVAVDLPSGWDADSLEMRVPGAFRADAVVTFAAPKRAHIFGHLTPGKVFGPVVVAGIGTPEEAVVSAGELCWAGSAKARTEVPRGIDGNKGKFGHVLLVGGARGKAGAPAMASLAALRAGAGLVTAAVPGSILASVAAITPELMMQALDEGAGQGAEAGLPMELLEPEALAALLQGMTVVGIGPGLGQAGTTPAWVRAFVERVALPMVIDADALNALAWRTELLQRAVEESRAKGRPRTLVLTPHPGEMARLVGRSVAEVEADRLGLARGFAMEHGVTLVLKGWRTLVAHPDGRVAVNTTGNPAMAKGGSGDILTGMVAAMLAQYGGAAKDRPEVMRPEEVAQAVEAAVFLHGLAGDYACRAQDEHTVLATDTVGHLWEAFRARVTDDEGFTWIAGLAAAGGGRASTRAGR